VQGGLVQGWLVRVGCCGVLLMKADRRLADSLQLTKPLDPGQTNPWPHTRTTPGPPPTPVNDCSRAAIALFKDKVPAEGSVVDLLVRQRAKGADLGTHNIVGQINGFLVGGAHCGLAGWVDRLLGGLGLVVWWFDRCAVPVALGLGTKKTCSHQQDLASRLIIAPPNPTPLPPPQARTPPASRWRR